MSIKNVLIVLLLSVVFVHYYRPSIKISGFWGKGNPLKPRKRLKLIYKLNYKHLNTNALKKLFVFIFFVISLILHTGLKGQGSTISRYNADFKTDSIQIGKLFQLARQADAKGDYQASLEYSQESLQLAKKIYGENQRILAGIYIAIGIQNKNLGKLNEAIDAYLKAEQNYLLNYGKNTPRLGFVYGNLGNIYKQKGNFADALKYHKQALVSYSYDPLTFNYNIDQANLSICSSYFLMKQYDTALGLIEKCINDTDEKLLWKYYDLNASIYNLKNENEKAKKNFLLSIRELIKQYGDDYYMLGYSYLNYAQFLIKTKEFETAKKYIDLARPIILDQTGEKGIDAFDLYYTAGGLYANQTFDSNSLVEFRKKKAGYLAKALDLYQDALIAVTSGFTNTDPAVNPQLQQCIFQPQCLKALRDKSSAYYQVAQLDEDDKEAMVEDLSNSLSAITLASDLLNKLRTEAINEDSKILISQLQNSTFINSVNIAAELYLQTGQKEYFETAFHNAERGKAASLMDNLTEQNAREVSLIPDSILKKEEDINLQLTFINEQIFEQSQKENIDTSLLEKYQSQLFLLEKEKNDLNLLLEEEYKEYYRLKYASDRISLDEIQTRLQGDEVILEYVFDIDNKTETNNLFLFLISKNDFELKKLPISSTTIQDIETLHSFLADPDYINISMQKYTGYLNSAYNLYKTLIEPVKDKIPNRIVTIIPDGKLSYIPFDALLYEKPEPNRINFRNLPYLIRKYTFNYSYSANLYLSNSQKKKETPHDLLAFAPGYQSNGNVADEEFNTLLPLTGITEEVENISKNIDAKILTGDEATESNFRKLYQGYDILHLAMHALLNDSLPMFSKLAFSPPPVVSENDDGWLSTLEIYNLHIKARLAVLSACNTGSGVLKEGEGVISLARGFFYAGCPSIIMTLWEIEDRSGAPIMDEFYRILSNGKKKPVALRMAKLKHLENADPLKAHPHFWLGYVTIGNTDAMYTSNDMYFFLIIVVIFIAVVIDQIIRHKKTRQDAGL